MIRAVAEIIKGEISESNIVALKSLGKKMFKSMRDKDETILFLSEYALKRGLYDDARAHVQSILETKASSIS